MDTGDFRSSQNCGVNSEIIHFSIEIVIIIIRSTNPLVVTSFYYWWGFIGVSGLKDYSIFIGFDHRGIGTTIVDGPSIMNPFSIFEETIEISPFIAACGVLEVKSSSRITP